MRDVLWPNCDKDEYTVIEINGVKVKQCIICGSLYQLAENEVEVYYHDSKDENGNFAKCPKCGGTNFKKTADVNPFEDLGLYYYIFSRQGPQLHQGEYACLNSKCFFVWSPPLF